MNVVPSGAHLYCHGCATTYDIFDVHALRNGYSPGGDEFIEVSKSLSKMMDIDLQLRPPSPKEIRQSHTKRAYAIVANAVADQSICSRLYKDAELKKYAITERGWDPKILAELGIGCLDIETIAKLPGLTPVEAEGDNKEEWLDHRDLQRTGLFGLGKLTFTFHDHNGVPVGFATRNTHWTKENTGRPKWNNTSGEKSEIFDKGSLLYNYHRAKISLTADNPNIYILEGQGDVVTAIHNDIHTAVACGRSGLTSKQVALIKRSRAQQAILCLDGDEAGVTGTIKLIEGHLNEFGGTKLMILEMPDDEDADSYIRQHGKEGFLGLKPLDAYEWMIQHYQEELEEGEEVKLITRMVPIIAGFSNAVEREHLCRKLATITNYSIGSIQEEVSKIVNEVMNELRTRKIEIFEDALDSARKDPDAASLLAAQAQDAIEQLEDDLSKSHLTGDYGLSYLMEVREENEAHEEIFPGYRMVLMPEYAAAFSNDWSSGTMRVYGGDENCGKTSFISFDTYNIICEESENNAMCFHMTIDDSKKDIIPKYITIAGKHATMGYKHYEEGFDLQLNHVIRPKYWYRVLEDKQVGLGEDMMYAYRLGYQRVSDLIRDQRLVLSGIPDVRDVHDFRRSVRILREQYPDRNMVSVLDNLHKLPLPMPDARMSFKMISNVLKDTTVEYDMSVAVTAEYNSSTDKRRKGNRPTNNSLAETRAIRYDANAITHMYNSLHVNGDESIFYHEYQYPWEDRSIKLPRVEAIIGKNKIDGNKLPHFFDFLPGSSWFKYVPRHVAAREAQAIQDQGAPLPRGENGEGWRKEPYIEENA
jgi:DNA primase catalytic core